MRRFNLVFASIGLAAAFALGALVLVPATPAAASGLYGEAGLAVPLDGLNDLVHSAQPSLAIGYASESGWRPALGYNLGSGVDFSDSGDDRLSFMVYYDILNSSSLTPYLGAGVGSAIRDIESLEFGKSYVKVSAGFGYAWSDNVTITAGYSMESVFSDGTNRDAIEIGARVGF